MQTELATRYGGKRSKGILPQQTPDFPLVTVITAVFNGAASLRRSVESVLQQDYPNIEHLILDAGSTDGTLDLLRELDDKVAFWKSEPDGGVYDAWNKGLALAGGEWIAFLGCDDEYLPGTITAYLQLARDNPDAEYMSSQISWEQFPGYSRTIGAPWSWPQCLHHMCSAHVGSMHNKRLFETYGHFDTSFRIAGDYELLLRAGARLRGAFMPRLTVRVKAGGLSDSEEAFKEAARAKVETGGLPPWNAFLDLQIGLLKYRAWSLQRWVRRRLA